MFVTHTSCNQAGLEINNMSGTVASPVARWALTAVKRSLHRVMGRRCKMDEEPAVQTMDCTPLMEALVDKETELDTVARRKREGCGVAEGDAQIQGVQRSGNSRRVRRRS